MSVSFINGFIVISPRDFTTASGENNDCDIPSSVARINTANNLDSITGATSMIDGTLLFVSNVHASNILVIKHNDSSSIAANRFFNNSGADMELPPKRVACYKYVEGSGWNEFVFYTSNVVLQSSGFVYFGDKDTDGTVRIGIVGTDFVFQQRAAGTYSTFNAIGI